MSYAYQSNYVKYNFTIHGIADALFTFKMYSSSTAYFCFSYSLILWIQLVKTSNLCHKVIFCILNKTAGNLCARKC